MFEYKAYFTLYFDTNKDPLFKIEYFESGNITKRSMTGI
jgi:hypothetical protein